MEKTNNSYYGPDESLHDLMIQENIVNVAVDVQALLRILVEKGIITREEVNKYREEVRNSRKYKSIIEGIERQRKNLQVANESETMKKIPEGIILHRSEGIAEFCYSCPDCGKIIKIGIDLKDIQENVNVIANYNHNLYNEREA